MFPWMNGLLAALLAALVASGLAGAPQGGAGQGAQVTAAVAPTATATPAATPTVAPTAVPASGDNSGSGVSAEIDGYMAQISEPLHNLRDNFDSMSKLMQAPYVTDDGWRADAAAAFDGIQAAHKALLQLEPPASLAEVHKTLTAGTEKCSQGAEVARKSIEEDSVLGLYAAAQLMTACGAGVTEAGNMLTELGLGG